MNYEVIQSDAFHEWLAALRDKRAKARITVRIDRVKEGNFGDHQSLGDGISELRITEGKGYRVYYTIRDRRVVILLCGGDKSSKRQQSRDIENAKQTKERIRDG